jgi:hypothetical protein
VRGFCSFGSLRMVLPFGFLDVLCEAAQAEIVIPARA